MRRGPSSRSGCAALSFLPSLFFTLLPAHTDLHSQVQVARHRPFKDSIRYRLSLSASMSFLFQQVLTCPALMGPLFPFMPFMHFPTISRLVKRIHFDGLIDEVMGHALTACRNALQFLHQLASSLSDLTCTLIAHGGRTAHLKFDKNHILLVILSLHLLGAIICLRTLTLPGTVPANPDPSRQLNRNSPPAPPSNLYLPSPFSHSSTPSNRQMTPPHLVLLQYMYPATSLWPERYLRAFEVAEKGDGMVRIEKKEVKRDVASGKVGVRVSFRRIHDLEGVVSSHLY